MVSEIYLDFLENILPNLLENVHIRSMYFQHDGAPPHFALNVRNHLDVNYPNRWIGRGGPIAWPQRSPDLNPLDYFVWGYLKTRVYKVEIRSREHLVERIFEECNILKQNQSLIRRSIGNLIERSRICIQKRGNHFEHSM